MTEELDSTLVIIGTTWTKNYVVPQWMKDVLEGAGMIDEFGDLRNINTEMEHRMDVHGEWFHGE